MKAALDRLAGKEIARVTRREGNMRKLVLYSDQILPATEKVDRELVVLMGHPSPTIGYIGSSPDPERKYYEERRAYYARLEMTLSTYIDETYEPDQLEALFTCDAIHLTGGNTYHFLRWLRQRHMLARLRQYATRGGVLIGVSAGAILMTPEIGTAALCGDTPPEVDVDLTALGLVDFAFVPHFEGTPSELVALQAYSRSREGVVYACRDGDGIVVEGDQVRSIGNVTMMAKGERVDGESRLNPSLVDRG